MRITQSQLRSIIREELRLSQKKLKETPEPENMKDLLNSMLNDLIEFDPTGMYNVIAARPAVKDSNVIIIVTSVGDKKNVMKKATDFTNRRGLPLPTKISPDMAAQLYTSSRGFVKDDWGDEFHLEDDFYGNSVYVLIDTLIPARKPGGSWLPF